MFKKRNYKGTLLHLHNGRRGETSQPLALVGIEQSFRSWSHSFSSVHVKYYDTDIYDVLAIQPAPMFAESIAWGRCICQPYPSSDARRRALEWSCICCWQCRLIPECFRHFNSSRVLDLVQLASDRHVEGSLRELELLILEWRNIALQQKADDVRGEVRKLWSMKLCCVRIELIVFVSI